MKTLNRSSKQAILSLFVILGLLFSSCQKDQPIQTEVESLLENQLVNSGDSWEEHLSDDPIYKCFLSVVGVDHNCDGIMDAYVVNTVSTSYQLCLDKIFKAKQIILKKYHGSCPVFPAGICKNYPCNF